jgi:hypothetical protein
LYRLVMSVSTGRAVKKDEEITLRYVDVLSNFLERQKMFWDSWLFRCSCLRCRDPTDFSTFFSSVSCFNCGRDFVVAPANAEEEEFMNNLLRHQYESEFLWLQLYILLKILIGVEIILKVSFLFSV